MRGAVRDFDEYILELQPEIVVGLDGGAHVIVPEYCAFLMIGCTNYDMDVQHGLIGADTC